MADMTITNQTANEYSFGPYQLVGGVGQTVTIDTTTNASLYLTDDSFADIVNALYALGYITVSNQPTPFPRVTGVPQLLHGDGSPEGVVFATQGSAFMRRDNSGAGNALYAKTTGPSLSTGWQAFAGQTAATPSTSLPASPSNGEQAILVDSTSSPTYAWLLQYSLAASKWIFLGGSPLQADTAGADYTASSSYTDLAGGANPSVTLPRNGSYKISVSAYMDDGSRNGTQTGMDGHGYISAACTGLTAADANATAIKVSVAVSGFHTIGGVSSVTFIATGLTASTLTAKYRTDTGQNTYFYDRRLLVEPITLT